MNAKLYTVPMTGTVQQCESYKRTETAFRTIKVKTYYAITISYETDSAQQRKIEKTDLTRSYQEGEDVSLMCNPDTGEAVMKGETVQDSNAYIFFGSIALVMIVVGVLCVKHGRKEM